MGKVSRFLKQCRKILIVSSVKLVTGNEQEFIKKDVQDEELSSAAELKERKRRKSRFLAKELSSSSFH